MKRWRDILLLMIAVAAAATVALILVVPQIDLEPGVVRAEQLLLVVIGLLLLAHSLALFLCSRSAEPARLLVPIPVSTACPGSFHLHC